VTQRSGFAFAKSEEAAEGEDIRNPKDKNYKNTVGGLS
jgi:hypothetical protein